MSFWFASFLVYSKNCLFETWLQSSSLTKFSGQMIWKPKALQFKSSLYQFCQLKLFKTSNLRNNSLFFGEIWWKSISAISILETVWLKQGYGPTFWANLAANDRKTKSIAMQKHFVPVLFLKNIDLKRAKSQEGRLARTVIWPFCTLLLAGIESHTHIDRKSMWNATKRDF